MQTAESNYSNQGDIHNGCLTKTAFDPSDYALGLIQRAIANEQDVKISDAENGDLYIFSARGEYISHIQDNDTFFRKTPIALKVTVLDQKVDREVMDRLGRNIDELMWLAAFIASKGRLMKGCEPSDVIHLKHWPNLTKLPYDLNVMRMASLFSRVPTSLFVANKMLGIPQPEINAFYSAAKCSGLAETINRNVEFNHEYLKPHKSRSLLDKIITRISGL